MQTHTFTVVQVEAFFARLVMIVMAAGIAFLGYSVITRPLAIPVAIVLWLGATAIFFLGIWGKLPNEHVLTQHHPPPFAQATAGKRP
jgi:hypothetical protein